MIFKLFANCIPVKGAKKCIIMDLQRKSYLTIPNDLYIIVTEHRGKSISELKAFFKNEYDQIIDNYFKVLISNELGFETDNPENFPDLNLEYKTPFRITNAIVDISEKSNFELTSVLEQLSTLKCKFVQVRFYDRVSTREIIRLLQFVENRKLNILGLDLVLSYDEKFSEGFFGELFKDFPRLTNVILYASPVGNSIKQLAPNCNFVHATDELKPDCSCGVVNRKLFSVNTKNYCESLVGNSCLNGKVSIDIHGNIKNCPSMKQKFGNIQETPIDPVLDNKDFSKLWSLTKDDIKTCQDCEFRYCCTDCRAFLENPGDITSKPLKCGYDPYSGQWNNWKMDEKKQAAIEYYELNNEFHV
nr:grasp-with-spasm system SPASM domain peptide maturase [Allomuricauda sp.]